MNKKKFQTIIKSLRLGSSEYPKAMMTAKQEANRTATVNCGGEWFSEEGSKALSERVMRSESFKTLLETSNATAKIEVIKYGNRTYPQIRINW